MKTLPPVGCLITFRAIDQYEQSGFRVRSGVIQRVFHNGEFRPEPCAQVSSWNNGYPCLYFVPAADIIAVESAARHNWAALGVRS